MDCITQDRAIRVVAFGASAGGLQALKSIISNLSPNGISTFIVAHHLAAENKSCLVALLAQNAKLPVSAVQNEEVIKPDHIYVCPPGFDLEIQGMSLMLLTKEPSAFISPSINRLFSSLADHMGENAIAIVLSGSGSDGALGTKFINLKGGIVIAQSSETAIHPSMPEAVIHSGHADLVGNCQQISNWLNDIKTLDSALMSLPAGADNALYTLLFQLVSNVTGIDLSQYKDATLRRQTIRRYQSLGYFSLEHYFNKARSDIEELHQLQRCFMISVSAFFRNPAVFDLLAKQLQLLVVQKHIGDSIRIWIPGCATGEEVYSIAILLAEILEDRLSQFDVRIFATDIDQHALEIARSGLYSNSLITTLEPSSRQQWFTPEGNAWRIAKNLRELCVFSLHDVISHPPFIKMDVISCRNLLIYFKSEQQDELMNTFHYGLNRGGLLLLGNSESIGFKANLFEAIDPEFRIFRRIEGTNNHALRFARAGNTSLVGRPRLPKSEIAPKRNSLVEMSLDTLVKSYAPPAVLVNASFEPVHFFGGAQRFFTLAEDNVDFSIFALCPPEIRNELKALCYRLAQENLQELTGNQIQVTLGERQIWTQLRIKRVSSPDQNAEFACLICFEETHPEQPVLLGNNVDVVNNRETEKLSKELADTREHLQAVIEELETSNEELQSLNEEVQTSSEELQSSNEELQASNEELTTLNDELRAKSLEANELNATLSNIQNSISTGLVVIDRDSKITRFNALATKIFGIVANDIGQSLYGVPCHLNLPILREQIASILAKGASIVERVHQGAFHYVMQLDPYHNDSGGNSGVVITFVDISELYTAEQAQKNTEIYFHQVWESCAEGLLVVNKSGSIVMLNPALKNMFGYDLEELVGQTLEILIPEVLRDRHVADRDDFISNPHPRQMANMRDVLGRCKDGHDLDIEVSLSNMFVNGESFVLATVSDISLRKQSETNLRKSEQRLRLALDSAHAGTWEWNLASNDNFWSDEIWKLYGLADQSVAPSFDAWKACVHPDDLSRALAILADAVKESSEFEFDWQVKLNENKEPRWLFSRGRPMLDSEGKPTHYLGIVIDITELKLAEVEIKEHRDKLEELVSNRTEQVTTLYNQAPCGYHSLDSQGFFIMVNDTELSWLGFTREEMIGKKRAIDIMAPHCHEVFLTNFPRLMSTGEIVGLEIDFVRKDGSLMPILLNARSVYDVKGAFSHTLSTLIDNTARKQAEHDWIAAREAAESANRAKSAFLANMSHEIRTPLSAIIGLSNIMRRGQIDPVQVDNLIKIDNAANHLLALINDILDLSKIEADKFILDDTNFDLLEVVKNVKSMLYERLVSKAITLKIEYDHFDSEVRGDPTRFTQALINLAANAVKFTEKGNVIIRMLKQEVRGEHILVRVEVEDSGMGIAPDDLQRLFKPFEQVDNSNTRSYGGTGLGLYITRRLVELMGGEIGVQSTPGTGSVFWFTVLLKMAKTLALATPLIQEGLSHEAILKLDFAGMRCLVVDDEPINRAIAGYIFEDINMDVTFAENGLEAIDLATKEHFSLVIMDMQMPEMDGIEATRKIRMLPGWSSIPIIAMTANAFAEDRLQCLDAGMNDFISKPFVPEKLYEVVLSWLTKVKNDDY